MAQMSQATIDAYREANETRERLHHTIQDIPARVWPEDLVAALRNDDTPTLIELLLSQIEDDNATIGP